MINWVIAIKVFSMVIMFLMVAIVGSIPIRLKSFKSNKLVLSFSKAFSGGLFLSVGLIHLLPEVIIFKIHYLCVKAQENFEKHYEEINEGDQDHFPMPFLIMILCFSLILFIEKIMTDHHHSHGADDEDDHKHNEDKNAPFLNKDDSFVRQNSQVNYFTDASQIQINTGEQNASKDEEQFKKMMNSAVRIAKKASFHQSMKASMSQIQQYILNFSLVNDNLDQNQNFIEKFLLILFFIGGLFISLIFYVRKRKIVLIKQDIVKQNINKIYNINSIDGQNLNKRYSFLSQRASIIDRKINDLTPYLLQIAIGIHAVFEGLAIGIEKETTIVLGISLAVCFHKWAEGLTLGVAFAEAGVDKRTATTMIMIQALMNPIGILIGWSLSSSGFLVTGVFESISAGTFLYIATIEVIVEEFSIARYKKSKFILFLLAIGFVCCIYFIEQVAGG